MLTALLLTASANAQFQQGKAYIGASLTSFGLNYSGLDDLCVGLQAQGGYLFTDNLMVLANVAYEHSGKDEIADNVTVGAGVRYYIDQNGIYVGLNCKLKHANHNYNDIMPGVEVGYAFFINRSVTVEPAVYYDQSFKKHSDYSTLGLKVGLGVYLFDD